MSKQKGRSFILQKEDESTPGTYNTIAGGVLASLRVNNNTVDVTDKDDDGEIQLLEGKFGLNTEVSANGIFDDDAYINEVQDQMLAGTHKKYKVVLPGSSNNGAFTGSFAITTFEYSGEKDGAVEYSITLNSAGAESGGSNVAFS